jgi:hypothetical protein
MTMDRTLNEKDLEDFARRIAFRAREHLEAHNPTWVYMPSFSEAVISEALAILKMTVLHERQMAAEKCDGHHA